MHELKQNVSKSKFPSPYSHMKIKSCYDWSRKDWSTTSIPSCSSQDYIIMRQLACWWNQWDFFTFFQINQSHFPKAVYWIYCWKITSGLSSCFLFWFERMATTAISTEWFITPISTKQDRFQLTQSVSLVIKSRCLEPSVAFDSDFFLFFETETITSGSRSWFLFP